MSYFSIAKNKKKALFFINVGIFLSVFALTSAGISIFIENKINKLEYEHQSLINDKTFFERLQSQFPTYYLQTVHQDIIDRTSEYKKDFFDLNSFTSRLISKKDVYLVAIVSQRDEALEIEEFYDFFGGDNLENEEMTYIFELLFDEEEIKEYKDLFKKIDKIFKPIINEKTYKEYKKIIYDSNKKNLITDSLAANQNFYEGQLYKKFKIYEDYKEYIDEFIDFSNFFLLRIINTYDDNINTVNEEIVYQSSLENKIIGIAFIFQLLVFTIIQFFEISSLAKARRKVINAKR